jgi:bifunctional NMN adenylyltransferase/nudix hydrolase
MKNHKFAIVVGNFQPFYSTQYQLVQEAINQAETVIIVVGSYKRSPSPKKPWSGEEREAMIRAALTPEENTCIKFVFVRDYLYKNHLWLADVSSKVSELTDDSESIIIVGHEHSEYMKAFPQWEKFVLPNIKTMPEAAEIRYLYFTHDIRYKTFVPTKTVEYLEEFKKTPKFKAIKSYFDALRETKRAWEGAPFEPIFHTVDAVVIKSGHVLCVRRGKAYGGGLIALPGGFLEAKERIRTGVIRELKEETAIALSKDELDKHIKDEHTFDLVERSERGRTITTAFLLDLGMGALPKVKGSDDADKAWWMPIDEFYNREEEFFEDHYHIADFFVGSPFTK